MFSENSQPVREAQNKQYGSGLFVSSVRHLPHPSLLRRPFRQSTNTPTHPLR